MGVTRLERTILGGRKGSGEGLAAGQVWHSRIELPLRVPQQGAAFDHVRKLPVATIGRDQGCIDGHVHASAKIGMVRRALDVEILDVPPPVIRLDTFPITSPFLTVCPSLTVGLRCK